MTISIDATTSKLAHYRAWVEAWRVATPSELPAAACLAIIQEKGPRWLHLSDATLEESVTRLQLIVASFKTAAKARAIHLGGKVPPSCDGTDVLSESYDARVQCNCSGLYPVPNDLTIADLKSCGCRAIEHMMAEGELVSRKEEEWNSSEFFSSKGLSSAMTELALCHSDIQPSPSTCNGPQDASSWPEVQAPDRKPSNDLDLDEEAYNSLYPTTERIRFSSDAKHFFALASGVSLVDRGIHMAIADSGNDILIGDYCEAATEDRIKALQVDGAAAFSFLKLCVYARMMSDWQFDHLVAQTIQFRIISYWRDHALSRRPKGVYGSRMTGMEVHRHIDLGMTVGIVSASMASGQTMAAGEYAELVNVTVLINDLVDFRGDTWRNQRENVVLRGVRGNLCEYLDNLLCECIGGAAVMIRRGRIFALMIMCFCSWMLMSSGHKQTLHGVQDVISSPPCPYKSKEGGLYTELIAALEPYGTLGSEGPAITMKRKELQLLYAKHRQTPESHIRWQADVVRLVLHPDTFRRLVDVVHYQWTGELGNIDYCA